MAYAEIKDFKEGVDTRRPAAVGPPASLVVGENVVITRGGDVESRKAFVDAGTLPAGTFGLHSARSKLYVFGSAAAPSSLPANVVYQRLQNGTAAMTELLDVENYNGKIYAIARYDDGNIKHFFNGTQVAEWDALAGNLTDADALSAYYAEDIQAVDTFLASGADGVVTITAAEPGTAFTIAVSAADGTGTISVTQLQANQAETAEVRATGSFDVTDGFVEANNTIDSVTSGGTELLGSAVPYTLDNAGTALAVASEINDNTTDGLGHGYTASSSGDTVTITAPAGTGSTPNGDTVAVVTSNSFVTVGNVSDMSGGVDAVAAAAQIEQVTIGTFDTATTYTITLNGADYVATGLSAGYGRTLRTATSKMYSGVRSLLHFSAIDEPRSWVDGGGVGDTVTPNTGLGFVNVASQDQGSELVTALGLYQDRFAIFSPNVIQIWLTDPDPANNQLAQVLQNTGTRSPKAVTGFGSADLLYLSRTGIRSLRARDQTNAAFVDDIGTRIDNEVVAWMRQTGDQDVANATSVIDPQDGRAWLVIGERIYVFSYFPGSEVSAWTVFKPGFTVSDFAIINDRLYCRAGDKVYVYGGTDGETYPADGEVTQKVRLPFIDARRIAGGKKLTGVDIIAAGRWDLEILLNPNNEVEKTDLIRMQDTTTVDGRIAMMGATSHFAPNLETTTGGRNTLSSVVVHFEDTRTA